MDKSPDAFRTISEVADALDVPPHVLRFWETRFVQVKPVKRGGGRRYYRPDDVRLLRGIRGLLYEDGLTIKGVQKILRERGIRHVIGLGTLPDGEEAAPATAPPRARDAARPASRPTSRPASRPAAPNGAATLPAASASPASAPPAADPPARPQADLFAEDPAPAYVPPPPRAGGGAPRPHADAGGEVAAVERPQAAAAIDRSELRRLVAELEALRAEMAAG